MYSHLVTGQFKDSTNNNQTYMYFRSFTDIQYAGKEALYIDEFLRVSVVFYFCCVKGGWCILHIFVQRIAVLVSRMNTASEFQFITYKTVSEQALYDTSSLFSLVTRNTQDRLFFHLTNIYLDILELTNWKLWSCILNVCIFDSPTMIMRFNKTKTHHHEVYNHR